MKPILLILLAILAWPGFVSGQEIELRISVKVILHPTLATRPSGITDAIFANSMSNANTWMANYQRGYRYRVTEIINIGGPTEGGTNGPSRWYNRDFRNTTDWPVFQSLTQNDSLYRLRANAVNVYVATGLAGADGGGGACPIPPGEVSRIACQGFVNTGPWWVVHELGHFFGLPHTFNGEQYRTASGQICTNGCSCAQFIAGNDGLADTLLDHNCWSFDNMAVGNYSSSYSLLAPWQQTNVVNTYFNVMAYHNALTKDSIQNIFTELQLDRQADIASLPSSSGGRLAFSGGRTHFVSPLGSDNSSGLSTSPLRSLGRGVTNSVAGDILLLRPGNYNQTLTINRPVTLRAPRTGWATIGEP